MAGSYNYADPLSVAKDEARKLKREVGNLERRLKAAEDENKELLAQINFINEKRADLEDAVMEVQEELNSMPKVDGLRAQIVEAHRERILHRLAAEEAEKLARQANLTVHQVKTENGQLKKQLNETQKKVELLHSYLSRYMDTSGLRL
jgi:chromosome segregation ATPase